jgi:hypothetical protein
VARGTWELVRNVPGSGRFPLDQGVDVRRDLDRPASAGIAKRRTSPAAACGVNPETLHQLVNDVHSIADAKQRDMILFAVKCSRNPQSLAERISTTCVGTASPNR